VRNLIVCFPAARPLAGAVMKVSNRSIPATLWRSSGSRKSAIGAQRPSERGRAPDYGIKDYDLGSFDSSDLSYEAEDAIIRRVGRFRQAAEKHLSGRFESHVQVINFPGNPHLELQGRSKSLTLRYSTAGRLFGELRGEE
jgi:hypothetical protein